MIHPIIVGVHDELDIFQPTMREPRGLPLREIGINQFVHAPSRCSPFKGGNSHHGNSNSCNARFGITYRPTQNWSNTIIHSSGNIKGVFIHLLFTNLRLLWPSTFYLQAECTNVYEVVWNEHISNIFGIEKNDISPIKLTIFNKLYMGGMFVIAITMHYKTNEFNNSLE